VLQQLLQDQITIVRAGLIPGPYGSDDRDWAHATRTVVDAYVRPVSSTEDVVLQQRTETRWKATLDRYADLQATDRVEWDDDGGLKTYEVDGEVERHRLHGAVHHQAAVLQRITGG
jgi:hypothetical protein